MTSYELLSDILVHMKMDLTPSNSRLVHVMNIHKNLQPGDHFAVPSDQSLLGPWHHAIFMGHDKVMHMTGENKIDAHIQEGDLEAVLANCSRIAIIDYENDSKEARAATMQNARQLEQTSPKEELYNIADFNCEVFAVICRRGTDRSALQCLEYVQQGVRNAVQGLPPTPPCFKLNPSRRGSHVASQMLI